MKAVGDYVYNEASPPPDLIRAFDYKSWGVNIHDLAPGEIRAVSTALNYYQAIQGYRNAASKHKTAEWSQQNEQAYELASEYLAERIKRRTNGR